MLWLQFRIYIAFQNLQYWIECKIFYKFIQYANIYKNSKIGMSQQIEKVTSSTAGKSQFLETVIDCITQRNNSPSKKQENQQQDQYNLNNLYGKAGNMISQLDTSINRCKKYNQAKINRKYEIIITDLQSQIKKISEKLKLEQDARSPTKKHISDILDKLVVYRDENIRLRQEVKEKDKKIKLLQDQVDTQTKALQRLQIQQPKAIVQRLPAVSSMGSVAQSIKNYLKDKQFVKKITNKSTSKLQKFLSQNKAKTWNWTIPVLLQQLDKWSQGINPQKSDVDMWKIRSNIARKFSDYMDDSKNLTKPSRMSIMGSELTTPRQQKYSSSKRIQNFSYNGSKQKLNMSAI